MKPERKGWSSREIRELFEEIVEELSLLTESQHSEHMVDITEDTDLIIPITNRIMERYTVVHIRYYSESTNDDFAEDLTIRKIT